MLYEVVDVEPEYSERSALMFGDEVICYDYGEPEDNSFGRNWAFVPVLLNKERSRWIDLKNGLTEYLWALSSDSRIDPDVRHDIYNEFLAALDEDKP